MNTDQLKHIPFFTDIDTTSLSKLAQCSSLKHFDKGELLFFHGDEAVYFYIVSSGWVKLFRDTLDGQESFLGLVTKGDVVGEINFTQKLHLCSAKAVNETDILFVPNNALQESIKDNSMLASKIIKTLNYTISTLELQLEHASTMNAAQRLGCFILRLANYKQTKVKVTLPYDKTLIASYLGMKLETFSRALNQLKSIGVTVEKNILFIEDLQDLVSFSCVSCSLSYDSCKE